ncbi:hypothetical protein [Lysobacter terrae]
MSKLTGIIAGLLLAVACGYAFAQSASFGLSLRVLPKHTGPVGDPPAELPIPPQARRLPPARDATRLLYAGSAGDARRFYETTLPDLGFYLTAQKIDSVVWERDDVRAELLFYPVVGAQDATGIIVTMRPRLAAESAAR